ncbi:alpha/beta hydrolase [Streptomyces nanshensis]|uniref:Serine aminopeptidase S33 domain-containing protein n=1 Tax=Streptomyces nanshensis TaxID=518642 RepID=A0A1E7KWP4_9ACTN|nr:alpha/beta fold hydrolase [Streptomyces nanshensis]OEV08358.1 hypothetical protein AN218_26830 [Streptomyces nanshensis]
MTTTAGLTGAAGGTTHTWEPPSGIAPRGTLLVFPGRGEHGRVYERFGLRLAADGYVVHALGSTPGLDATSALALATALAGPEPAVPVVLVGSDTGALQALQTVATADPGLPVEGVILAGTAPTAAAPGPPQDAEGGPEPQDGWEWELAARTACPTHRRRLTDDAAFVRGQLTTNVPAHLLDAARPALPALLLHGEADPVTPPEEIRELAAQLPRATLAVLHDGLHDVLNDAAHRTIAAAVVQWLERLRTDRSMSPLLTVESEPGR